MLELRVVLVLVPPLLADLLRQVLATRGWNVRTLGEFGNPRSVGKELAKLSPHVVLLGSPDSELLVSDALPPDVRILSLSADLTQLLGPRPGERTAFTADNLVNLMTAIHGDLDPAAPPYADPKIDGRCWKRIKP
jgi:hypothetical protein